MFKNVNIKSFLNTNLKIFLQINEECNLKSFDKIYKNIFSNNKYELNLINNHDQNQVYENALNIIKSNQYLTLANLENRIAIYKYLIEKIWKKSRTFEVNQGEALH